jgi:hypothetical protein
MKCRYCLEFCDEWVWVEISTSDGLTLLTENHCFLPDSKAEIISILFFLFLENMLDTHSNRFMGIGDFNRPGFDREWLTATFILNLREMQFTPMRVFSALMLSTAVAYMLKQSLYRPGQAIRAPEGRGSQNF